MAQKGKANRPPVNKFAIASSVLSQVHFVSNRLSTTGNAHYRKRFGVSISEFRMMVVLNSAPGLTGARIHEITGLDKGAISRTLNSMKNKDISETISNPRHPQYRHWYLSPAGAKLHHRIVGETLMRENTLLDGFSDSERKLLLSFLSRMIGNTSKLQQLNARFSGSEPA